MRVVQYHVRRSFAQRMRGEAVGHTAGPHPGIPSGKDIHGGIADDYGFLWMGLGLLEQRTSALGIGLLGGEAVASIDVHEELAHPKGFDDGPGWVDRFVGKHSHLAGNPV